MDLLDSSFSFWEWIKVPSHIDLLGNDRADRKKDVSPLHCTYMCGPLVVPRTPPPPKWMLECSSRLSVHSVNH